MWMRKAQAVFVEQRSSAGFGVELLEEPVQERLIADNPSGGRTSYGSGDERQGWQAVLQREHRLS
jgi:hypothetical protein